MGNSAIRTLIEVVSACLNGTDIPDCKDWEQTFELSKKHSLGSMFYLAVKDKIDLPYDFLEIVKKHFSAQTAQQVMQEYYESKLFDDLRAQKIKFMPLKGHYIKKLYPLPEMRTSCDIDIFYDKTRKADVDVIMKNNGFHLHALEQNNDHWQKDIISVEMHFALALNRSCYKEYYKDVWERAVKDGEFSYRFNNEDLYIYNIIHSAKHFVGGGFGIRTVLDIFLMKEKLNLNSKYIDKELEKLKLDKFEKVIVEIASAWFKGGKVNENLSSVESYILLNTTYGVKENGVVMRNVDKGYSTKKAKRAFWFKSLFPPFRAMKQRYPLVGKIPILLPFAWVLRWIQAVFTGGKNVKILYGDSKKINDGNIKKAAEILEITGLKSD